MIRFYEIADIIDEIVEIRRNDNETYAEVDYAVGFCNVTVKGLDADLCAEQCNLEIVRMLQRWYGYDVFTMDEDELSGVDGNGEAIKDAVTMEGMETKNVDEDEGVDMCDNEQSSIDDEFTTESDENECRRIDSMALSTDTKRLD